MIPLAAVALPLYGLVAGQAPAAIVQLVADGMSTMAVRADGRVLAWGAAGKEVSLTLDGSNEHDAPFLLPGIDHVARVATGGGHACVLSDRGRVACWGRNWMGAVTGAGQDGWMPTPQPVLEGAVDVRAGGSSTCARLASGAVRCWGDLMGSPSHDVPSLGAAQALSMGVSQACAVRTNGTLACWGMRVGFEQSYWGGDDYFAGAAEDVPGLANVSAFDASGGHACAVSGGRVSCWGWCNHGELGEGSYGAPCRKFTPRAVDGIDQVEDVSTGGSFSCALTKDGHVWCWGANGSGELGLGDTNDRHQPTRVDALSEIVAITTGSSHACALRKDGAVLCWGADGGGQLGVGKAGAPRLVPEVVPLPS